MEKLRRMASLGSSLMVCVRVAAESIKAPTSRPAAEWNASLGVMSKRDGNSNLRGRSHISVICFDFFGKLYQNNYDIKSHIILVQFETDLRKRLIDS